MYIFKPIMFCLVELIGEEVRAGDSAIQQIGKTYQNARTLVLRKVECKLQFVSAVDELKKGEKL